MAAVAATICGCVAKKEPRVARSAGGARAPSRAPSPSVADGATAGVSTSVRAAAAGVRLMDAAASRSSVIVASGARAARRESTPIDNSRAVWNVHVAQPRRCGSTVFMAAWRESGGSATRAAPTISTAEAAASRDRVGSATKLQRTVGAVRASLSTSATAKLSMYCLTRGNGFSDSKRHTQLAAACAGAPSCGSHGASKLSACQERKQRRAPCVCGRYHLGKLASGEATESKSKAVTALRRASAPSLLAPVAKDSARSGSSKSSRSASALTRCAAARRWASAPPAMRASSNAWIPSSSAEAHPSTTGAAAALVVEARLNVAAEDCESAGTARARSARLTLMTARVDSRGARSSSNVESSAVLPTGKAASPCSKSSCMREAHGRQARGCSRTASHRREAASCAANGRAAPRPCRKSKAPKLSA